MALGYLCPKCNETQPTKGLCESCERARWRTDGALRRAKHDPRDAVYRHSDWGRVRLAILKRDRFNCHYAYDDICLGKGKATQAAHILPHNGLDDPLALAEHNLVAACAPCNRREQDIRRRSHDVDL